MIQKEAEIKELLHGRVKWMIRLIALNLAFFVIYIYLPEKEELKSVESVLSEPMLAVGSMDPESELIVDEGYLLIKQQCQSCHNMALVTQNFFTREVWLEKIRWMQAEQNLWDLGEKEDSILDYLAKHYNPSKKNQGITNSGRRQNLNVEWYSLD